ncbi:DUF6210 family protein [Streptomyces sp. NPDC006173]|uniref:DUF6210 family protein n=1 Tax=Streptomyces sp. NPDC006173 TaxID=3155349 RepID=UPI0033E97ADC
MAAPTGVIYQTQGGGYDCIPYEQEGYLLPFYVPGADAGLNDLFVGALKDCGSRRLDWPRTLLDRLRQEVADLHIWGSANQDDAQATPPVLHESRLAETDEAWVPVLTPDGPGHLVWQNSDQIAAAALTRIRPIARLHETLHRLRRFFTCRHGVGMQCRPPAPVDAAAGR